MSISAKVICDNISPQDIRLTTMQLRYPKFIHGEFMTHRVFSRNASSSRAIPVERLIQDVLDDPAMPVFWGKNRPGMQAVEEMDDYEREQAELRWLAARDEAVLHARHLADMGAHKQIVNRIIEPWCHINVVVTATEWANFYALRRHPDAQPEMKALADAMWEAQRASEPRPLQPGEWHLPYVSSRDTTDIAAYDPYVYRKLSVARCARVSYLTHEGKTPSVQDDLRLYDRLVGSVPLHASPAEHQATPDVWRDDRVVSSDTWLHVGTVDLMTDYATVRGYAHPEQHGNLYGWRQYRKFLPNEAVRDRTGSIYTLDS